MRLADSRTIGIFPLQHHGFKDTGWALQLRASIFGVRIIDRFTSPGEVGHWRQEKDGHGDINGGQLWFKDTREVSMFRFATPVKTMGGERGADPVTSPGGNRPPVSSGPMFGPSVASGGAGAPPAGQGISAFASAATLQSINSRPGGTTGAGPAKSRCGVLTGKQKMLPILNRDFDVDDRIKPLELAVPKIGDEPIWPKFPRGMIGIALAADEENEQHDLFHPTDSRLFAINAAGDPRMGTPVHDLTPDFEIDPERKAPLQALTRVVKKPIGGANTLAWQIGRSGCGDVDGGYVFDQDAGGVARVSRMHGGFLDVAPGCSHQIGRDADGNPISPGHLFIASLFREDNNKDGPLNVTFWQEGQEHSIKTKVRFGWNPRERKWDWWTTAPMYFTPTPVPPPTLPPTPPTYPNFDWSPFPPPTLTPGKPVGGMITTAVGITGSAGDGGGGVGGGAGNGGGRVGGGAGSGGAPRPSVASVNPFVPDSLDALQRREYGIAHDQPNPFSPPKPAQPKPTGPGGDRPPQPTGDGKPTRPLILAAPGEPCGDEPEDKGSDAWKRWADCREKHKLPTDLGTQGMSNVTTPTMGGMSADSVFGQALGYLMMDQALAVGQELLKPYNYDANQPDFRYMQFPDSGMAMKRMLEAPISGQITSFGAQGGASTTATSVPAAPTPPPSLGPSPPPPPSPSPTPPSPPPSPGPTPGPPSLPSSVPTAAVNIGATGDPWNYTQKPTSSKFRGGTATGGRLLLPPEKDMAYQSRSLEAHRSVPTSSAYEGVGPGAYYFAGLPDKASGRPKNCVSWGQDDGSGDLDFFAHYGADAGRAFVKFDRLNQRIGFKARTSYYGYMQHFITASRNWTFPDYTGQVMVTPQAVYDDLGGSPATLGTLGASGGPANAAQFGWAPCYIDGTVFYVPIWL
jgi:hypothetical protein